MACLHFSLEVKYDVSEITLLNFLKLINCYCFLKYSKDMKKVQRMLNFYTYKRLFCANCDVIAQKNNDLK